MLQENGVFKKYFQHFFKCKLSGVTDQINQIRCDAEIYKLPPSYHIENTSACLTSIKYIL
jgi:hypothetical protein